MYMYAQLKETIRITDELVLGREDYYIYLGGVMFVFNVILIIAREAVVMLPNNLMPIPKAKMWSATKKLGQEMRYRIKKWFSGLGAITNLLLAYLAASLYFSTIDEPTLAFDIWKYPILLLLISWFGFYVVLFLSPTADD